MDLGLHAKRALVMGASSGLGKAIARTLAEEGARVAICSRDRDKLEKTAARIGAAPYVCDLSKPGEAACVVESVISDFGGLEILVTNTGGPPPGAFADVSRETWIEGFHGIWLSAVEGIKAALPAMTRQKWGRVLMVTSVAAREPVANLTISNGLRAGLHGLANSLSREVAAAGVTVNAMMPGYTKTQRLAELGIPDQELSKHVPARRLGTPGEFAALVAFLASEQAGYITGQAIGVDGGLMMGI